MKFELKTENEDYSKSFSKVLGIVFILALIIPLCDIIPVQFKKVTTLSAIYSVNNTLSSSGRSSKKLYIVATHWNDLL